MENNAIADNWSLQDVASLLRLGLEDDVGSLIEIDRTNDSHSYKNVPRGALALEALFDLVADVVLREQVWVDDQFTGAWADQDRALDALVTNTVVVPFRFRAQPQELVEPRDFFVSKLCVTKTLRQEQLENERGWASSKQPPNRYLSQVLWGGAGMLARSVVYDQPYTPHPVRRRLMIASGLALREEDPLATLLHLVEDKQAQFRIAQSGDGRLASLQVKLPALASQVIRESQNPSDLLKVALQLRGEYAELRSWLGEYQRALRAGDFSAIEPYQKVIRSVSKFVDSKVGKKDSDAPSFTLGIDWFKIAGRADPIGSLVNRFGVRSQINRLIFTSSSQSALQHLLGLFGQRTTKVGMAISQHFSDVQKSG